MANRLQTAHRPCCVGLPHVCMYHCNALKRGMGSAAHDSAHPSLSFHPLATVFV